MKKILITILGIVMIFILLGCSKIKKQVEAMKQPDHEKVEDAHGILDKILGHIAETNPELSFEDGTLVDSELGVPHFEISPYSEIKHFDEKDVVDGYIVRPVVDVENPRLLIVIEAADKKASEKLVKSLGKVKSDQQKDFKDSGILTRYIIDENKTIRQGNFLLYATWDKSEKIVKVFERHVR